MAKTLTDAEHRDMRRLCVLIMAKEGRKDHQIYNYARKMANVLTKVERREKRAKNEKRD